MDRHDPMFVGCMRCGAGVEAHRNEVRKEPCATFPATADLAHLISQYALVEMRDGRYVCYAADRCCPDGQPAQFERTWIIELHLKDGRVVKRDLQGHVAQGWPKYCQGVLDGVWREFDLVGRKGPVLSFKER